MALPLILLHCALRHYAFCQAEPMDSIVCPWKILVSLVELLNSLLNSLLNWNLFKCKIVRSEYVQPWHWLIGFLMSWLIVESKFGQSVFGELTICWKSTIVEVGFVLTDPSPDSTYSPTGVEIFTRRENSRKWLPGAVAKHLTWQLEKEHLLSVILLLFLRPALN